VETEGALLEVVATMAMGLRRATYELRCVGLTPPVAAVLFAGVSCLAARSCRQFGRGEYPGRMTDATEHGEAEWMLVSSLYGVVLFCHLCGYGFSLGWGI